MSIRMYIALAGNDWGSGETRGQAVKALRRQWVHSMPKSGDYHVYSCPEGSTVNAAGNILYAQAETPPILVAKGSIGAWKTL